MRANKSRNNEQWTEARFWGFIRSGLRQMHVRWDPCRIALEHVRRPNESDNKRLKWEYQCRGCSKWFPRNQVQAHHVDPVGTLKCADDLPGFVERMFVEVEGYCVVCQDCHKLL